MPPATPATPRRRSLAAIAGLALSGGVPRYSLIAAVVVGTILNLINQGVVLFGQGEIDLVKCGLTYVVPYCVATYGAVYAKMRMTGSGATGGAAEDAAED